VKAYVRPRRSGKTHELIKLAAEERLVIVCSTVEMVRAVEKRAGEMGLDIPQPVSFRQFTSGHCRGRQIKGFAFDDAEQCLQQLAGPVPVAAISMTGAVQEPAAVAGW
jgi:hypothetical protein